jgi:adenosylhomocysteine nucleosidase
MLVAVTFAMRAEFASWRRLRSFRQCVNGPVPTYGTRVGDVPVRVLLTGVGQRAAIAAAEAMFQDRPDVCIASGLAGGLHEGLQVAEIIASGSVRGDDGRSVESDPRLFALALRGGASSVRMYSSPTVVVRAAEKRRMREVADAVDMESAAILGESSRLGIPCIAIRAISDLSTVELPLDLNQTLTEQGQFSPVRTMAALARRPQAVPQLVRLGLDARRAAMALTAFLDRYIEQLGASSTIARIGRAKNDH